MQLNQKEVIKMVRHGRKEQFSITLELETADIIYTYMDENNIIHKNKAFEYFIHKGENAQEKLNQRDEDIKKMHDWVLTQTVNYVLSTTKNKSLKSALQKLLNNKDHHFEDAIKLMDL